MEFTEESAAIAASMMNNYDPVSPWTSENGGDHHVFKEIAQSLYDRLTTARQAVYEGSALAPESFEIHGPMRPDPVETPLFETIPEPIRKSLMTDAVSSARYNWVIHGRPVEFTLVFYGGSNDSASATWVRKVLLVQTWLRMAMDICSDQCANTLRIIVYLHPEQRELPASPVDTLSPVHINGGVATACSSAGEICVYREQEWMKVLIHETFHALGLDTAGHVDASSKAEMEQLFPIPGLDLRLSETYTEVWARIINAALVCLLHPQGVGPNNFVTMLEFVLGIERIFALYQAQKLLGHMGLSFSGLYAVDEGSRAARRLLYRENTHVFAYYILPAIVYHDLARFLSTAHSKNIGLVKLQSRARPYKIITDSVHRAIGDDHLNVRLDTVSNHDDNDFVNVTTRMSAIEN